MKEYKIVEIREYAEDTQNMLNTLASKGWTVKCSYAKNNLWLILEKEVK